MPSHHVTVSVIYDLLQCSTLHVKHPVNTTHLKYNRCLFFTGCTLPLLKAVILQKIFSWILLQQAINILNTYKF